MMYRNCIAKNKIATLLISILSFYFLSGASQQPFMPELANEESELLALLEKASSGNIDQKEFNTLQEVTSAMQKQMQQEWLNADAETRKKMKSEAEAAWDMMGIPTNDRPSFEEMLGLDEHMQQSPPAPAAETPANIEKQPDISGETAPSSNEKIISPTAYSMHDAHQVLSDLLAYLEQIRTYAHVHPLLIQKFEAWFETFDDLIHDMRIIHKKEFHRHLITDAQELFKKLLRLRNALIPHIHRLIPPKQSAPGTIDDPYETLRIDPQSSAEEIKKIFDRYVQENDPEQVRARSISEGLNEHNIQSRVRAAKLNIKTLQEAYDKISDPQIRAQTDRILDKSSQLEDSIRLQIAQSINPIIQALTDAVYEQNIQEGLEKLIQSFEPEAITIKKNMEMAEIKRLREQEAAKNLKPIMTPGSYEPYYPPYYPQLPMADTFPQSPMYNNWHSFPEREGFQPSGPAPSQDNEPEKPTKESPPPKSEKPKKGSSKTKTAQDEKTEKQELNTDKETAIPSRKPSDAKNKTITDLLSALDTTLSAAQKNLLQEDEKPSITPTATDENPKLAPSLIEQANNIIMQYELLIKTRDDLVNLKQEGTLDLIDKPAPESNKPPKKTEQATQQDEEKQKKEKALEDTINKSKAQLAALTKPFLAAISGTRLDSTLLHRGKEICEAINQQIDQDKKYQPTRATTQQWNMIKANNAPLLSTIKALGHLNTEKLLPSASDLATEEGKIDNKTKITRPKNSVETMQIAVQLNATITKLEQYINRIDEPPIKIEKEGKSIATMDQQPTSSLTSQVAI